MTVRPVTAAGCTGVFVLDGDALDPLHHEAVSLCHVAVRTAQLLEVGFHGRCRQPAAYAVAARTLLVDEARAHGLLDASMLLGGVVPSAHVATKAITHPLIDPHARAPAGWNAGLGGLLSAHVLPGFTAFEAADARRAAARLLPSGPVRLKRVNCRGGHGQHVVRDLEAFDDILRDIDPGEILTDGLVIEKQLDAAFACSVGWLTIGPWSIAYVGRQREIEDPGGNLVYGGSDLRVIRGDRAALVGSGLSADAVTVVEKALAYDAAVERTFPSFYASRRNYDVILGSDARGVRCCGVLEQSWRVGGATPAELAALHAFKADPGLQQVRASTHEA